MKHISNILYVLIQQVLCHPLKQVLCPVINCYERIIKEYLIKKRISIDILISYDLPTEELESQISSRTHRSKSTIDGFVRSQYEMAYIDAQIVPFIVNCLTIQYYDEFTVKKQNQTYYIEKNIMKKMICLIRHKNDDVKGFMLKVLLCVLLDDSMDNAARYNKWFDHTDITQTMITQFIQYKIDVGLTILKNSMRLMMN